MHRRRTALLACALAAAACGDYSAPSEVVNGTATASAQTPGTNFAQYQTFTVTNTIQVYDNTLGTNPPPVTQDAAQIAAEVQKQMTARGYTFVPFTNGVKADLVVALYAFKGSQAYGSYYCGWYYWGYYPYDCGYYYAGSYNYGTLVLRMGDLKNAPPHNPGDPANGDKIPIVWGSAVYGVLSTQSYNLQRVLAGIDKAFEQSPYLHR